MKLVISENLKSGAWSYIECDECGEKIEIGVQIGEEPYYESATATICRECLTRAVKMISEPEVKEGE